MKKEKVSFSITPQLLNEASCLMNSAGCKSQSEFFMKAVEFYIGYLHTKNNRDFLGELINSVMESRLENMERNIKNTYFKQAVTFEAIFQLIAKMFKLSQEDIDYWHNEAVDIVKSIKGGN